MVTKSLYMEAGGRRKELDCGVMTEELPEKCNIGSFEMK